MTVYAHVYKGKINFLSEGMKDPKSLYSISLRDAKKMADIFCAINTNYTYFSALYWNTKCGTIRTEKLAEKKKAVLQQSKLLHEKNWAKNKNKDPKAPKSTI
jgi:hypothetical protein